MAARSSQQGSLQPNAPLTTAAPAQRTADSTDGHSSAAAHGPESPPAIQPAATDVSVGCAGPCNQQACPRGDANCLEGGAPTRAKALTNADGSAADPAKAQPDLAAAKSQSVESERTDMGTMSGHDERAHSSRPSKRAAQHERTNKQAVPKRTVTRTPRRRHLGPSRRVRAGSQRNGKSPTGRTVGLKF